MTMAQAIRTRMRSAPFDFDLQETKYRGSSKTMGDILATERSDY